MKKVTIGGERIGSGNKMQVDLHGYERSTHNKSKVVRTSMSCGTLVPIYTEVALPADTWDIGIRLDMQTQQTLGALFGGYKVQIEVVTAPWRLYVADLHNNRLKIGLDMAAVKLPIMQFEAKELPEDLTQIDNSQVNQSSVIAYQGIRGIGNPRATTDPVRTFNALAIIALWDYYKNYHANKQEEIGAVIHTTIDINETVDAINLDAGTFTGVLPEAPTTIPPVTLNSSSNIIYIGYTGTAPNPDDIMIQLDNGTKYSMSTLGVLISDNGTLQTYGYANLGPIAVINWSYRTATDGGQLSPQVETFPLENIDKLRDEILYKAGLNTAFNLTTTSIAENLTPYKWLFEEQAGIPNITSTQEGLPVKAYLSDMFNNWLNTEWIDGAGGITEVTAIDVSGGTLEIDQLNIAQKVWRMLNRIAVSDGSYRSYIETVYDTEFYMQATTPIYHGGMIQDLVFQEVVSTAATEGKPLGELAGRGTLTRDKKGGYVSFRTNEHSMVMILMSITPKIDYSQGNKWFTHLLTMDDPHKPQLDGIGFQELITEQMHWAETDYDGTKWVQKSAGKQPAWLNYMTDINDTYGTFASQNDQMYMTLNRRYELETYNTDQLRIKDLTTYIDPVKYNHIFADTRLDAMNFMAQIGLDIEVRRKMSGKIMPNL